jgi:hypothetical protein
MYPLVRTVGGAQCRSLRSIEGEDFSRIFEIEPTSTNSFRNTLLIVVDVVVYSRITSTKSPLFCITTFSASLTNLTALLPQSRNYSCYVSRPILAPPPFWLHKHTDLRAHDFAHPPDLWHQPRLANVTCAWSWRHCGIKPAILASCFGDNSYELKIQG